MSNEKSGGDSYHFGANRENLDFLIQSLVKLSRMESGIIAVHPEDTAIKQMLESIQQQFNVKVREKNITLRLCDTDLHVRM